MRPPEFIAEWTRHGDRDRRLLDAANDLRRMWRNDFGVGVRERFERNGNNSRQDQDTAVIGMPRPQFIAVEVRVNRDQTAGKEPAFG